MSLQNLIMSLLSNIRDPAVRIDVASTINYIYSIYISGNISEDQARDALYEVCSDVIRATAVAMTEDEIRKKTNLLVEEFIKAFRLEGIRRRVMSTVRPRAGLPL